MRQIKLADAMCSVWYETVDGCFIVSLLPLPLVLAGRLSAYNVPNRSSLVRISPTIRIGINAISQPTQFAM